MNRALAFFSGSAFAAVLLLAVGAGVLFSAAPDHAPSPAPDAPKSPGRTIVVNSTADSGPGTLRKALIDAQSGDTITFDPIVFPPTAPVTISVASELPHIDRD